MAGQTATEGFQTQIEDLFVDVVDAALLAQGELDAARRSQPPDLYSIPRVSANVEFQLTTKTGGRVAIIFPAKKRADLHRHNLGFVLTSSPSPPEIPAKIFSAGQPPLELVEPPFMVGQQRSGGTEGVSENELRLLLVDVFRQPGERARVALPGKQSRHKNNLSGEADKIERALAKPAPSHGMLYFELATSPRAYLVVRLADKSRKDGLYVVSPGQNPVVEVFSYAGDGRKDVAYPPLHRLLLAIRGWLRGAKPSTRPAPKDFGQNFGIAGLQGFVRFLYEGYFDGLQHLASQLADARSPYPTYYDLTKMEAEISYSVPSEDAANRELEIAGRPSTGNGAGSQDYEFIESSAVVKIERSGEQATVRLELLAPEFVLIGKKRQAFVDLAEENAAEIARTIAGHAVKTTGPEGPPPVEKYEAFLKDPDAQDGVVVLLAYKGKRPSNQFLVAWPASGEEGARDFVFSCKLVAKGKHLKVTNVVMCVEDELDQAGLHGVEADESNDALVKLLQRNIDDDDLSGKEYKAFHDFFHAVNVWRIRSR